MPVYSFEGVEPNVSRSAFIHPDAVIIGDVAVGEGCYIGACAVLRGDFGKIVMEDSSNLQDTCVVHGTIGSLTLIMSRAHVGHGAIIHGCVIGEDVLVGMNSVVMDGSVIGDRSIIGSGSMAKTNFKCGPRSLVVGSPAKFVRVLSEAETAKKGEATNRYVELAKRSLKGMKRC